MLQLPNGCSCSRPTVFPKNWENGGPSMLKLKWYIQYWFRDPNFSDQWPNGRPTKIKGMNEFKTLAERRAATKLLLKQQLELLNEGYNPITKTINRPILNEYDIDPYTPFADAINKAASRISCEKSTREDLASAIKYITKAAIHADIHNASVSSIRTKHLLMLLDVAGTIKKRYTAHTYNKYRTYLMMLFKVLVQLGAADNNPVRDIEKKATLKKIRQTLSANERALVDTHLHENYYQFWRLLHIFYHSGSREVELLKVKKEDVSIELQHVKYTIKKGKQYKQVLRPIKDIALPLWKELYEMASPGDYIFSVGLVPGKSCIRRDQITRRWREHVKKKLDIQADFYSLKHLHTTEVVEALNVQEAAKMNAHTSTAMVVSIYDVNRKSREFEQLRTADVPFVKHKAT